MPDTSQQAIEDLRDCLVSGGVPPLVVTSWERIFDVLRLADKYGIAPLADACTFYLSIAISPSTASKMFTLSDKFGLLKLRKAVMQFLMRCKVGYEAAIASDEYESFSADLFRELRAYEAVRKEPHEAAAMMPLDGQWGNVPHEFPEGTDWQHLSKNSLRRACFERLLGTAGTSAELVARLSNQRDSFEDDGPSEPAAKRQRTIT